MIAYAPERRLRSGVFVFPGTEGRHTVQTYKDKVLQKYADGREPQRKVLFHALDIMHESPACTGLANHAMLMCRKP